MGLKLCQNVLEGPCGRCRRLVTGSQEHITICRNLSQNGGKPIQDLPLPPAIPPRAAQNRYQRPLAGHLGPIPYTSSMPNTPKSCQKCPRACLSVHKRSMAMQNLSKIEPKTLPHPVLEQFWSLVFATLNLYRFCMVCFWIFY